MTPPAKPFLAVVVVVVGALAAPAIANFSGTDVFIPSLGHGPGSSQSQWYASIWVNNPNAAAVNVTFRLLLRNQPNPSPQVYNDTIPAGDTRRYDDVLGTMFGATAQTFGAVRVTTPAGRPVIVNARSYNKPAGADEMDTTGQFYAAIPASFAIGANQKTELLGVYQTTPQTSSEYRYNYGFVETTGSSVTVQVTAYDETGPSIGSKSYTLGGYEARQYNITDLLPQVSTTDARLEVVVTSGPGQVVAFGSGIANRSNDPSTFEMSFRDELLAANSSGSGLTSVTHDGTLQGDGTVATPLAIANGGVSKTKLAASGGTSGQVLSTDGTALTWQNAAGLTLPYSGSGSTAQSADLFKLGNNGGGRTLHVLASGDTTLWAENSGVGIAVHGNSLGNIGVHGESSNNIGVRGLSHSNVVALQGVNDSGTAGALLIDGWNKTSRVFSVDASGNTSINGKLGAGGTVAGTSSTGNGVEGTSSSQIGVRAVSSSSAVALQAVNSSSTTGALVIDGWNSTNRVFSVDTGGNASLTGKLDAGGTVTGNSATTVGVFGTSDSGQGVSGRSNGLQGVQGTSISGDGVRGDSNSGNGVVGATGSGIGMIAQTTSGPAALQVKSLASSAGALVIDGRSNLGQVLWVDTVGNLSIAGRIIKAGGSFKIDHPLDPANKYLSHSFVESPDMKDIYDGTVVTDADGRAVVELPAWFEALNRDFRYQLTVIGRFAQAMVEQEIEGNRFVIRTNLANVKVSWQVTGIRKDAWANAHRIPVEEDKTQAEQGFYLHPELFGQPAERSVGRR